MLFTVPAHFTFTLASDLEGQFATKIQAACFRDGEEEEHQFDFFRLWGRVVRRHYNGRTTISEYHYVEDEDLELFNIYYPEGSK
jgi:hypothetical protein